MRQLPELTPFKVKCQPDWRKMPQLKIQPLRPHNFEANYNRWINIQKIYRPKRSLYQELIRNRRSLNLA